MKIHIFLIVSALILAGCSSGMSQTQTENNVGENYREVYLEYLTKQDAFKGTVDYNLLISMDTGFMGVLEMKYDMTMYSGENVERVDLSMYFMGESLNVWSFEIDDSIYVCLDLAELDEDGYYSDILGDSYIVCEESSELGDDFNMWANLGSLENLESIINNPNTKISFLGRENINGFACDKFETIFTGALIGEILDLSESPFSSLIFESCYDVNTGLDVESKMFYTEVGNDSRIFLMSFNLVKMSQNPVDSFMFDLPGPVVDDISEYMMILIYGEDNWYGGWDDDFWYD